MHPAEVVADEVQRQSRPQVVPIPAEGVRQAGEPAKLHPHVGKRAIRLL